MIKTKSLNSAGIAVFEKWLEHPEGETASALLADNAYLDEFADLQIDPDLLFASRLEFGSKLNEWFASADFHSLMSSDSDGFWAWLALVYFNQLTAKGIRRSEHYIVKRKGSTGSLAYRHAVRTPYELVFIHGESAEICLSTPMHTFGDMTEQLASRQSIAHNKGFFQTASELYIKNGVLKRGASSKPKKPKDRNPGERTGLGSVRRLAIALQRLDLTFDTEEMLASQMKRVLPKEFGKYVE
ncbi:hypothetical protein [Rhodoferax aquaticus]|uniref:Uncharacterized protein n=1 Tax=Rhodoferax aquaticus TaxID=2527691 RepID=A0A515EUP5_9BURK|nr:hypothetical protein [Rhodoferax aquaticus]QDL56407.1 hypothetical protein EXZ61_20855 [Rhodoferax aquaticus]